MVLNIHVVLFSDEDRCWKITDIAQFSGAIAIRSRVLDCDPWNGCYEAPELIKDLSAKCNTQSDIWSLGCLVFELISCGKALFQTIAEVAHYSTVWKSAKIKSDMSVSVSIFRVDKLLDSDANNRPSAERFRAIIQDVRHELSTRTASGITTSDGD